MHDPRHINDHVGHEPVPHSAVLSVHTCISHRFFIDRTEDVIFTNAVAQAQQGSRGLTHKRPDARRTHSLHGHRLTERLSMACGDFQ